MNFRKFLAILLSAVTLTACASGGSSNPSGAGDSLDFFKSLNYDDGMSVLLSVLERYPFETYSKPNIRPSTADYYRRFIDCHIVPTLGNLKLRDLTTRHIQKLYNDLKDHGRVREAQKDKTPGLSNAYIRGLHTMLHNCLNREVKERLILRNPSDDCIVPKQQKKEMKILQAEDVSAYLKAADERGVLPLFFLELVTGLRKGELVALLWSDLDLEHQTLSVSKQITARGGQA